MAACRVWRPGLGWSMGSALATCLTLGAALAAEPGEAQSKAKPDYLDAMIQEAWEAGSVKPSPTAADADFLRRAYLDVLGRIPNVQEATTFLESKETGKRIKLVEYLLANPDYAKNFGNIWTVTLVGRGNQGRMVDRAALVSWLRQQFAANRPWNEIAYDLISAKRSNKENGGQLPDGSHGVRRRPLDLDHHPGLPSASRSSAPSATTTRRTTGSRPTSGRSTPSSRG
ncbi:MAG: DUF1549 domain-containing protein [Singulisphaera sp.]